MYYLLINVLITNAINNYICLFSNNEIVFAIRNSIVKRAVLLALVPTTEMLV